MKSNDKIEASAHVLAHEIAKLDSLGLSFAASLVRIAHLDLQMRLYQVTEKEIDLLSFLARVVEQEKLAQESTSDDNSGDVKEVAGRRNTSE